MFRVLGISNFGFGLVFGQLAMLKTVENNLKYDDFEDNFFVCFQWQTNITHSFFKIILASALKSSCI